MAIVANEIPNVRYDLYAAERAKTSNDAQMITLVSQFWERILMEVDLLHKKKIGKYRSRIQNSIRALIRI